MNSAEKQRILTAYDRAGLVAALAARGFYVIGEVWRGRVCGMSSRADPPPSGPDMAEPEIGEEWRTREDSNL